jgi:predicted RecA/RadA family phage recombinase
MADFIQDGASIDYTPGSDVAAGDVIVQGDLVGVSKSPIPTGHVGALAVQGVFDFPKEAEGGVTFAVGAIAYWDAANSFAVATDGAGANKRLGKVLVAAADADALVRILLIP